MQYMGKPPWRCSVPAVVMKRCRRVPICALISKSATNWPPLERRSVVAADIPELGRACAPWALQMRSTSSACVSPRICRTPEPESSMTMPSSPAASTPPALCSAVELDPDFPLGLTSINRTLPSSPYHS